jgi:hypothetical protein
MLGDAIDGEVRPEDFVWEERGGVLVDLFVGRRVLFLASAGGAPRDVYRARVRLTRAGRPLGVRDVHDLTVSPGGDEGDLVAEGRRIAFTTRAGGAVQGVTVLDLDGPDAAPPSLSSRLRAAVARWERTGSTRGATRAEIVFGAPPPDAKLEIEGDLLVLALGHEAVPAALRLSTNALDTGDRDPFRARAHVVPEEVPPWSRLVADGAGALLGDSAAAALARRLDGATAAPAPKAALSAPVGAPLAASADGFPPSGAAWVRPTASWLTDDAGAGLPPFAEAALTAATSHGSSVVRLVAIDTRRVDLRLEAGTDEPRSATGLHGFGRLPDDASAARVAAVFTTGPDGDATDEARRQLGVVVEGAPLAPPKEGLETLAFARDGAVRFGPWPGGASPDWLASLRQTGAPLDATPDHEGAARERSALCALASGQLVVAVARGVDRAELARALAPLACASIVPLASAPGDVGFAFVRRGEAGAWESSPLAPDMPLGAADLARGLRGDFAYAVLRSSDAPRPREAEGARVAWAPDAGAQPAPAFIPAVYAATATELGAEVHLLSFAAGRAAIRVRSGSRELGSRTGVPLAGTLADAEQSRVLAAFGLGTSRRKSARGLATNGTIGVPFHGGAGAIVADDRGARVVSSDDLQLSSGDAVELPLTADEGKLRREARDVGTMRPRAAACTRDDGSFVVAWTTFDTDEATTQALLDVGCVRVVALDRGSHAPAFASRAGADPAPERRYDVSTLYVVAAPLTGRAAPLDLAARPAR